MNSLILETGVFVHTNHTTGERFDLLTRRLAYSTSPSLSARQIEIDQISKNFVSSASDWKSLTSMSLGSLAYGFAKVSTARFLPTIFSNSAALFSEVLTFRASGSLFRGEGFSEALEGKAFLSTTLDFAMLKGVGKLLRGTSPVLSHVAQSGTMVLANELGSYFNLVNREKGSLTERWILAEVENAQMTAGMSFARTLSGNYFEAKEASLKVESESKEIRRFQTEPFQLLSMNGSIECDHLSLSAAEFLRKIREGEIQAKRGRKEEDESARRAAKLFLVSAVEVFGVPLSSPPIFLKVVSGIWADLSKGNASDERSQTMGKESGEILDAALKLARTAQMPPSLLNISLHTLDINAFVASRGWLLDEIKRLDAKAQTTQDFIELQTALLLQKNERTLMSRAIIEKDPEYMRRAAKTLPEMLETLFQMIQEMRKSSDPNVLEAADLLGGDWGSERKGKSKRKGNDNSIIGYAFGSGTLQESILEVKRVFESAEIIKDFNAEIERLKSKGETAAAVALEKNKGSIICQALAYGKLTYPRDAVSAFEGPAGFLMTLERSILEMEGLVDERVIQTLRKNIPSIVSYALAQGNLNYAKVVVAMFAGENGFVEKYVRLQKSLEGNVNEAALLATLRAKEDRIYHQALYRASFGPESDREFYNWMKVKIKAWLSEKTDEEVENS